MARRTTAAAAGAALVALALVGCTAAGTTTEDDGAPTDVAVEAYVEPGAHAQDRVGSAAGRAAMIGVDGVTVADDGTALNDAPAGITDLAATASGGGAAPELLVSNYSETLGDFSPEVGTALLASVANRERVARQLAALAASEGMSGVQIDLESLRGRDRAGLVAFAETLHEDVRVALGDDAEVSMAVMASTTADGYRETGYDLAALADHVDRFVLMTYDQHGPWSDPGTVGALPWAEHVVTAAEDEGLRADRIDLGIAGYGYVWASRGAAADAADPQLTPAAARRAAGSAAHWSARDSEWSASLDDGRELHWSDARSYRARVSLAEDLGLHGVALWSLNSLALPSP
ncbi:glycosyl hydrolase family 18 protein [Curtobacterium sp. PhB115]|uniref:glycosyl hydrolase family 18 protein n=1 Tax=Curtobacterium sp. PhB115 TaxID=2485173 RepID=UPI000F4C1FCB|nr:glycosyl hydrolase family 18 protein [Curtobacterium sp. PhB115]ROP61303.1 glycosyl hydrolase family 18 (putative chitinase) [Curtobacterium sp. PhB115]